MLRTPRIARRTTVLAVAASLACATLSISPAHGQSLQRSVRGPFKLAQGVTLRVVSYSTPWQVRILTIRPQRAATVEEADSGPFGSYKSVSKMGHATGAVAGVNGDFGSFSGFPDHWSMIDGVLRTSGIQQNQAFAIADTGTRAYAGTAPNSITATTPGGNFKLAHLNAGAAGPGQFVGFTPIGGKEQHPTTDMCAARLVPSTGYHWADTSETELARTYTVKAQPEPCQFNAMGFGKKPDPGTVVLQVRRSCACSKKVTALSKGDSVTLTWSSWARVADQIGAQPQLVAHGVNVAPGPTTSTNYFYGRNPRTGVGITQGCTDNLKTTACIVYVITVDGRQSGWSIGMTLPQFADLFLGLSPPAYDAVNLDGGGATEMWVKQRSRAYCQSPSRSGGCIVNRPSDGLERPNITSLQVLGGSDRDLPAVFGNKK
jgi:Phosphodiester glycosidase